MALQYPPSFYPVVNSLPDPSTTLTPLTAFMAPSNAVAPVVNSPLVPPVLFLLLLTISLSALLLLFFNTSLAPTALFLLLLTASLPPPIMLFFLLTALWPLQCCCPCFKQPLSLSHCYSMLLTTSLVSNTVRHTKHGVCRNS